MNTIYLDRQQCQDFAPGKDAYFGDNVKIVVAADAVLRSKSYDDHHKNILKPLGQKTLVLTSNKTQGPGWFDISEVR